MNAETLTVTPEKAVTLVDAAASNPDSSIRDATGLKIGQAVRHGDCYLVKIDRRQVAKRKVVPLAEQGNLVPNSPHGHHPDGPVVLYPALEKAIPGIRAEAVRGPVVIATDTWVLRHAEHAPIKLPAGAYQCMVQLDWATSAAVRD